MMEVRQIERYLPFGWKMADIKDHGIVDIDIDITQMMSSNVATVIMRLKRPDCLEDDRSVVVGSVCCKDMDTLRALVMNEISMLSGNGIESVGDGSTSIR